MTVEDLTLSQVGPSVEGLLQLMQSGGRVDWAGKGKSEKNIRTSNSSSASKMSDHDHGDDNGAGDDDQQQQVQLAYLGSLEEMRAQLQRMAQFYQDDLQVLLSLTTLLDRVDEALNLVSKATQGFTKEELGENVDGSLSQKEEESILSQSQSQPLSQSLQHSSLSQSLAQSLVQSLSHSLSHSVAHSLHQSLHKSTLHSSVKQRVIGISILLDRARLKAGDEEEEEEEDSDESEWDEPLTEAEISQLDSVSLSPAPTDNLRQSFMEIPPPEPVAAASSSSSSKKKNKGKCEPVLCKICYDEFTDYSEIHTLDNCEHIYCKECLQGYLTTQITNGGVLNLDCPHPECDSEINILDIYALCDAATLDKYERFVVLAALRADPDVRWCPMPNCSAAIKGPPKDDSPWITCTNCQLQVCFACGDERHDPVSCGKEAKELIAARRATVVESEELFEAWHKGKPSAVKACPKCRAYIEKNLGCNHMTCQSCKNQFCWLCLAHYESSHYNSDAYPECKGKQYWTAPIVSEPDPELQARYNWIYFPPNYQYAGVGDGPLEAAQREQRRQAQSRRIKTRAKKVGLYVGVGVAVATLGIPAAIIGGPIYGVFKLHKAIKAKKRNQYATEGLYL